MSSSAEQAAMHVALDIGVALLGGTSPNPPVGCVILDRAGQQVGVAGSRPAGQPHAELAALAAAGERARGGTAVVTLEPCNHVGRTGPCSRALIAAGIGRVVYAPSDPNPVAAGGSDTLRAAGVKVEAGLLREQAERGALEAWLGSIRRGRPVVTGKYAATLDGRVAAAAGTSRWITSPAARADVHRLRAKVDAIVVGSGTVLADDPQLTVRLPGRDGSAATPLRVVRDRRGRVPATARVFDDAAPTLRLTAPKPAKALAVLAEHGVISVLLEGGSTLAGAFLAAACVDRVIGYLAPALLGAGAAGIGTLAAAARLRLDDITRIGSDLRLTGRPIEED